MPTRAKLHIVDDAADARFRELATSMALDPDDPWVGHQYVDHEWTRGRHAFAAVAPDIVGREVLEFGCHVGASAVVLGALGARATAVDVDDRSVSLARANAARYGVGEKVAFHHVADTRKLPFAAESFDLISCNSVLEYVPDDARSSVQAELDRVLRPGGVVIVMGTSNRLWPRELHSGALGVNYLPRRLAALVARRPIRSVSPWRVRSGFGGYQDLSLGKRASAFLDMKAGMGVSPAKLRLMAAAGRAVAPLGISVGMLMPSVSLFLQKPH